MLLQQDQRKAYAQAHRQGTASRTQSKLASCKGQSMTPAHKTTPILPNSRQPVHLCGFLTPPVAGADLRAALVASCLRGALPPVDLRAVCFVRAMAAVDEMRVSGERRLGEML